MIAAALLLAHGCAGVAVGKPRALLYDESAYESDWQWLPLARRQRYRDYLMREYRESAVESGGRPTATREFCIRWMAWDTRPCDQHRLQGKLAVRH